MEGHAAGSQALGVGHRGVVVLRGMVVRVLLEDVEDTGRGLEAGVPGADEATPDFDAIAIDGSGLGFQVHPDQHGAGRRERRIPDEGIPKKTTYSTRI